MLQRMIGAARLDVHTFEDVESDQNATKQALLVVVLVSIASGIGAIAAGDNFILNFLAGMALGIIGWAVWAYITFFVGTKILNTPETHADWGQMARGTAFAQTPGLLRVFGIIPYIGGVIILISAIWQLVAMVIAVRQCLDYQSTGRAIGVVLIAVIPYIILVGIVSALLYRAIGQGGG
ncbi:MAG: YIP1 family protein [Chloroflexi bacterium]|nr:YIP1 family protein [Chloroflexota bacterium]MDA1219775.1 YIP1 family protein [Chloroflexota bacterium]